MKHAPALDASAEPAAPTAEALKQELFERLDKNLTDYRESMVSVSKAEIIDLAGEITARYEALEYMKTGYDYKTGEVEFLLQFHSPLTLFADGWPSALDGIVNMDVLVSDIIKDECSHGHYALVVDADNPTAKEKGREPESAERQSVIKRIRAAKKEPKQPHREKHPRDKSEPEH